MSTDHRTRPISLVGVTALVALSSFTAAMGERATAATITASYEQGRADVVVNGYGTTAMGTFRLADGSETHLALCIEADVPHSAATDAYGPVEPSIDSAPLDALLWWLDRQPTIDDDTAVAASALAWFYAGARRSFGPLVWADGTRGFAPISPDEPQSWDALAPFSMSHPLGLVVPGSHLDAAERRVAELHRLATRLSGTWSLEVDAGRDSVVASLAVGGSPLADRPIEIRIEPAGGGETIVRSVRSDADGRATVDVPPTPDGYTASATVAAPGPHREWDGAGAVQRLATPTTRVISASASRAPDDGHVVVRKVSTDPTIGVEGAVFDLVDADGAVVATARTGADGLARFVDVDRAAHPGPYSVRETAAPPGLIPSAEPVVVEQLGVDPTRPPVIDVVNRPATAALSVRKVLSVDGVGPADRTGFEFTARRRSDGAEHRLVTGADGTAGPIELALGSYEVCETAVPSWATRLVDTGCRSIEITVDAVGSAVEVAYVNDVPEPGIDTHAADPSDGDRTLELHQTEVVDRVRLDGLVAGTTYRVRGELVDATNGDPTGFVGWAEFTADDRAADGEVIVDVTIEVDEPAVGDWVVVESVYVGEVLLAHHADLLDVDQTVTFVAPPSTTTPTTMPSTTTVAVTTTTASTTTSTTTAPTTTTSTAPTTSTTAPPLRPPATLPPTGSDAVATALRLGDVGFVLGVGLLAVAGLVPARRGSGRDEAGR